ncbi:MAG: GxxExxY protein [Methanocorpusculum parvum]|nr:GxxExxY protein [Methanocorpusculum parvum]
MAENRYFPYFVSENDDIILADEVYQIMGATFKVYNTLGYGFLEAVYEEALGIELSRQEIPFQTQKPLSIYYDGEKLKKNYFADVVCYDKIILELKIKREIDGHDRTQIVNYLKATGCEVGLVINFGNPRYLEWKKYVFTNKKYLKSRSGCSSNNLTENKTEYNTTPDIMR